MPSIQAPGDLPGLDLLIHKCIKGCRFKNETARSLKGEAWLKTT